MIHRLSYWMKFARPCVAVAVAYALALQVVLLSVMAASSAMTPAADGLVICYGSGNTNSDQQRPHSPAGFADCTLSCAQGLSATAILPSDIAPVSVFVTEQSLEPAFTAVFHLSTRSTPKLAQGPPQSM